MKPLFAVGLSLVYLAVVQAQNAGQGQQVGKQVITEVKQPKELPLAKKVPLAPLAAQKAPTPVGQPEVAVPSAVATTINIAKWDYLQCLTDDQGQKWLLVSGYPFERPCPKQISGWQLTTVDGRVFLFTVTGKLFGRKERQ